MTGASETSDSANVSRHAPGCTMRKQVHLNGVVDPSGAVGGSSGGRGSKWSLSLTLNGWKIEGEPFQPTKAHVSRSGLSESSLDHLANALQPYTLASLLVKSDPTSPIPNSFILIEIHDRAVDDLDLKRHALQLQQPVLLQRPPFGTFALDRTIDYYEAAVTWLGQPITLAVPDEPFLDAAFHCADALWSEKERWSITILDFATREFLETKNESWLDEGEDPLDAASFKSALTLESITVRADGSFEFHHSDGDLFWGHSIVVSGSLSEGPTYAELFG